MTDFVLSHPAEPSPYGPEADPRGAATLALFGHDLRAALSDVVGGLRLVDPAPMDALTRAQVDRVRVAAEVLARLLDHGLAVMLGQAPVVRPAHLDLQSFLIDLDLRWSGRAQEKGLTFLVQRDPDLPAGLALDRVALDRVLSNLLGNAFKSCDRGRVVCSAGLCPDGGLRLTVRDDGPGFPDGVLQRPLPDPRCAETGVARGSGMGLHIAADMTRRLGGKLTLRNLDPFGAEAQVDLPLAAWPQCEPRPAETGAALVGKRVLIADDNPTSQTILARLVTDLGAEVMAVGDGIEAMERVARDRFDLLFIDMQMPRMSGMEVIACLRNLPGTAARLPVIAVTAHALASHRRAILAAGANDMLTKPLLSPHAFAIVVRGVLNPASSPLPARPLLPTARPAPAPLDRHLLGHLLDMAGPETGRDLLDRLINDLGGVQRGLVQASARPDWEAIRRHSHVLISLAGAVGGLRMGTEAEALNLIGQSMDRVALDGLLSGLLTHLDTMIDAVRQARRSYPVRIG